MRYEIRPIADKKKTKVNSSVLLAQTDDVHFARHLATAIPEYAGDLGAAVVDTKEGKTDFGDGWR